MIGGWESSTHQCSMRAMPSTAKKLFPSLGSNARFTRLLRDRYSVFGPMGMPGINLEETRFPVVVQNPKASGGKPDAADVIYGIHRCAHGHGEELPAGFALYPDAAGPSRRTRYSFENGAARLSDRVIFGLLAVAVLSPVNHDQRVPEGYYLAFSDKAQLMINEWCGREADFAGIVALDPAPLVKMDFGDWMNNK